MRGEEKPVQGKKMSLKKELTIVAVGLTLFGIITVGGMELSCSSWSCISCHEMKELGSNWKFSKHGPYNAANPEMHNCLKCHAQPGAAGFLKAKISGFFCLAYHLGDNYHVKATKQVVCIRGGCHKLEYLDKADRSDRVVSMNHAKHIKVIKKVGTRSQCMPCHRNIAHGDDKYLPDMKKDCFVTCHNENGITSPKCTLCHPAHPDVRLKDQKASLFALHKDANISCTECHIGIRKATKNACDRCHKGNNYGSLIIPYEKR
jgi:nitrate/TMAO reductase-like tetraheme cytochrome c subunit